MMTKDEMSFQDCHDLLMQVAADHGGSAADAEAWREDYDAGKTPLEAWADEWGDDV